MSGGRRPPVSVWRAAAVLLCLSTLVTSATAPAVAGPAWQLIDDGEPSPGAWKIVYDTARQRPVMLVDSGANSSIFPQGQHPGSTWELVDGYWKRIFVPDPVPWVTMGCAAYDEIRDVMVVFGTWTSNETWEYDGTTWTQRVLPQSPPSRNYCAMAYDASRSRIVMFGGETQAATALGDHWEYDGTTWAQRTFNTMPSPRSEAAMAYDSARQVVVLFGGMLPFSTPYRDTWEFDGTRWRQKSPTTIPKARGGAGLAYDPIRARMVMFGGWTPTEMFSETWEWNGTNWTLRTTPDSPSARRRAATIWDSSRNKVLIFGGEPPDASVNDTWTFDGTTWTKIADEPIPANRAYHGLVYDPARTALVLVGGFASDVPVDEQRFFDTWFFDGGGWSIQSAVGTPAANDEPRLSFDPAIGTVRGFSGYSWVTGLFPTAVYELTPSPDAWTQSEFCCPRPSGRVAASFLVAPGLGGAYLYGGQLSNNDTSSEFWELNDGLWTLLSSAPPPGQRKHAGAAYDSKRKRLILHGGNTVPGTAIEASDTWAFDGTTWTRLIAMGPMGDRSRMSLAYDVPRDRVVLFGDGPGTERSTWEFDGVQWIALSTPFMPDGTRCSTPLAYDPVHEVTWLFGGRRCNGSGSFNDTWAYGEDDDGDGRVGGLDNCRQVANPTQTNGDGDPAGDVCDCAPGDATAFATPKLVSGLLLLGSGTTSITWEDQAPAIGSGARYDVAKGTLGALRSGSVLGATCLASQIAVASASDGETPASGEGFWYSVRSRNVCGIGSFGSAVVDAAPTCP